MILIIFNCEGNFIQGHLSSSVYRLTIPWSSSSLSYDDVMQMLELTVIAPFIYVIFHQIKHFFLIKIHYRHLGTYRFTCMVCV